MKVLVTGGAGFIGSAVCRHLVHDLGLDVVVVDKMTYAASDASLLPLIKVGKLVLHKKDILDRAAMEKIMAEEAVGAVMHLAAESHVDRSIDGPGEFIQTNIVGTFALLQAARNHYASLDGARKAAFRFHHISTDEVFGELQMDDHPFTEQTPYAPKSPYSASKAASDHLVRAWHETYGLPIVLTNCSNNFGPYHFPEKLIPLMILNALDGKPLPVYGKGNNVRDWLYVEDHARALALVLLKGKVGESYNIGGNSEKTNLEVVHAIADGLDKLRPLANGQSRRNLVTFVSDRPGHDLRYAIDGSKIRNELGWSPREDFETGLAKTIQWYLDNEAWWKPIREGRYSGHRLGQKSS